MVEVVEAVILEVGVAMVGEEVTAVVGIEAVVVLKVVVTVVGEEVTAVVVEEVAVLVFMAPLNLTPLQCHNSAVACEQSVCSTTF